MEDPMKNLLPIKIPAVLITVIVPLLVSPSQKVQTAYANPSSHLFTVMVPDLNVREGADISSRIIGKVHQGDRIEVIYSKNNWNQMKLPDSQTGWVYDSYVTPTESMKGTVKASVLNIRENPSLSSPVVGKLTLGSNITIRTEQAGWAKIESSSGVQGWVNEQYLSKDVPASNPTQPVAKAPISKENTADSSQSTGQESLTQSTTPGMDPSMNTKFMPNSQEPLKGKTIVLDPGHGGNDDGTTSITRTHEKALTLATVQVVGQKLENAGANVLMTRTGDTYIPLQDRSNLSNQNHADAFISFHYNWSNDPSVKGITDFYYHKSKDDSLASDILKDVVQTTGLKTDGTKFDNLAVLRNNSQPSTLIELGFLSNKQDDSLVESPSYRDNVAQGVYQGLLDYFSNKK